MWKQHEPNSKAGSDGFAPCLRSAAGTIDGSCHDLRPRRHSASVADSLPSVVPALPVLIPAAIVVWVLLLWRLRQRDRLTLSRTITAGAACLFGIVLLRSVLFPAPIVLGAERATLPPWPVFVQLIPVATVPRDPSGMVLNIVLFVPIGVLLPFLVRGSVIRLGTIAFLLSVTIEVVQLVGDMTVSTGRVADIDDVIGNTIGALVGIAVVRLLSRVPQLSRVATPFVWWPSPDPRSPMPGKRGASARSRWGSGLH
ncbi:hypothetical protein DEI82_10045 [Curtobacterium sp. MCBD17_019]|nr:hypothetical protein DEI82_10045 [Curtobacterium sp. MCBD17_019]